MYKTKLNRVQKVVTKVQYDKLIANGNNPDKDYAPVVKFFNPWGAATWLISELDPNEPNIGFGLCDLGMGSPELGYVDLTELIGVGRIERDLHFKGNKPMSEYCEEARSSGSIRA